MELIINIMITYDAKKNKFQFDETMDACYKYFKISLKIYVLSEYSYGIILNVTFSIFLQRLFSWCRDGVRRSNAAMIQKKNIFRLLVILCLCIVCCGQAWAGAIQDQIDSTGRKINELERELESSDQNISAYQREQKVLEQDISSEQEKISRLSAQLDETRAAIKNTREEIARTQKELKQSRKDSKEQYEQMKQRIKFMYENSMDDLLSYVLEAGSLPEALRRANYFQSVMAYDREKLDEYKAITRKIKKAKETLISDKEELEALEEEQTQNIAQIDAAVAELKSRLSDKIAQIQSSQILRQQYEQELAQQKEYEKELERRKAEEDLKREEEIRRQKEELERRRREQEREQQEQRRQAQQSRAADTNSSGVWYDSSASSSGTSDLELLATIIYCEAGNQPYEGQLAVGSVVLNRVASSSFPNSISGVIYQSGQFSPVASGRFAGALAAGLGSQCRSVAQEVLNGKRNVTCLYFRVDTGAIDGIVIGDHVFY